jgi:hypothetical protein
VVPQTYIFKPKVPSPSFFHFVIFRRVQYRSYTASTNVHCRFTISRHWSQFRATLIHSTSYSMPPNDLHPFSFPMKILESLYFPTLLHAACPAYNTYLTSSNGQLDLVHVGLCLPGLKARTVIPWRLSIQRQVGCECAYQYF